MFFKKSPSRHPDYPRLPENLRQGAIVAVEPSEHLRYTGTDLSFVFPEKDLITEAISAMSLFGLNVARAYARQNDALYMVQFHCRQGLQVCDAMLFRLQEEVFPEDEAAWSQWLDEEGLIGGPDLNAPNGLKYVRAWQEGGYAPPVEMEERIFTQEGAEPTRVQHRMMLYSRPVGESQEYILLSADTEHDTARVRIWCGIELGLLALKVY